MNRFNMTLAGVLASLFLAVAASANTTVFDQGFETDTDGINPYPGPVARVASGGGSLGVASADGGYHAEVTLGSSYGDGFYTWNGGASSFWPGYVKQSIKVYIDPAAGQVNDGWWWDAGLSNENGNWVAGGGFGVRKTAAGTWSMGAEDVYGGFHYVGHTRWNHDNTTALEISTAGWYTLATEWVNSATLPDLIDQVNTVRDASGSLLWIDTVAGCLTQLSGNPSGAGLRSAGGMSYSWLGSQASKDDSGYDPDYDDNPLYAPTNTMTTLAFDDVHAEIIPEPATMALLGAGGLVLIRRRRA